MTTYHEGGPPRPPGAKLSTISHWRTSMAPLPFPQIVVGVDIAATSFMAAWARPGQTPVPPRPFEQTTTGFAAFHKQLAATGVTPKDTLVVLEATGSYWVALA